MKKYKFHPLIVGYSRTINFKLLIILLAGSTLLSGCSLMTEKEEAISYTLQEPVEHTALTTPTVSYQPAITPASVAPGKPYRTPKAPAKTQPSIERANHLMQQGQRAKAADMYYRSAFNYPSPQRERVMLQAAEISASLGEQEKTRNYLSNATRYELTPANQIRYRYIQSLLALQNRQPHQALALLPRNSVQLPPGLSDKIAMVRKRALDMGATLSRKANTAPATASTGRKITATQPTVQYQTASRPQDQPHTTGLTQDHHRQTSGLIAANNQPGLIAPATQTTTPFNLALPATTNKVAVLLPGNGALSKVGDEIYQGIQDAQAITGNKLSSKRYTVDKNTVLSQYQQAVADGADMVVGPLDKESLATLTAQPQLLSIPVLSLNYLPDSAAQPNTLYQFGLSPEDEAQQIAEFALNRNQINAAIMAPDSKWGKRLANSFAGAYQQGGGNVMDITFYSNSSPATYLKRVRKLLAQAQGADMVFLAASPTQARLIRPLLKDQVGLIPVYATSHIFSGRMASNKDIDLDGIIYTEIPYILKKTSAGSLDELKFPRLYALGMDSILIAKNLTGLSRQQPLAGQTGQIRMDTQGRVQRRLEFATFINGQPHSLSR